MIELYAARHGETVANIEQRITGRRGDSPLTEKGIEQAKQLGKSLETITFDAVYSSPLHRARDTVGIALGDAYTVRIDDRLAEIGLGVMEGMTYRDASERYPEGGMLFFTDPAAYCPPPGGEHLEDLLGRIGAFLDDIARKHDGRVFALTHGYALRALYACTAGGTVSAIAEAPVYSNGDAAHYLFENGRWKAV